MQITKSDYHRKCEKEILSVRIPKDLMEKLEYICARTNRTKSDVITILLSQDIGVEGE